MSSRILTAANEKFMEIAIAFKSSIMHSQVSDILAELQLVLSALVSVTIN